MISTPSGSSRRGFTVIEVLVVLLILGVLAALLLPNVRRARPAARRTQCKNNLKQIGLALHNYHDVYGTFPPACTVDADGKPLHSWRTLILPYLDHAALYKTIDLSKPWDDPVNAAAAQMALPVYACPSSAAKSGSTSYLAIVTSDSILRPQTSLTISQVKDDTSNTLVIIEAPHDRSVPWMSPQDADKNLLALSLAAKKAAHDHGFHGLFADGATRFLNQKIDPNTWWALTTAASGDTIGEY